MKQNTEPDIQPSASPVNTTTRHRKFQQTMIALTALAIVVAAAILNPSQNRHFEEIDQVIKHRELSMGEEQQTVHLAASYNNYFLFSTVTFGNNKAVQENHVLSYGLFGTVKTTDNIKTVIYSIYEWDQKRKPK